MSMHVFTVALSRLVPLLFAASAILVGGRLAYDALRPRHVAAARTVFALIVLGGAVFLFPWVRRGAALVSAEYAFWKADWATAADRFDAYARQRGSWTGRTGSRRALALMNLGRYAEAEAAFLASFQRFRGGTVKADPNDILSLGLCRYYTGNFDAAERLVRAVSPDVSPVRDYVLGRILDRRGDAAGAITALRASLARAPCFYPGLYHLVRTLRRNGREAEARAAVDAFCPAGASQNRAQWTGPLSGGQSSIPPEREFTFVQED